MPIYFSHLKSDNILVINKTSENEITTELKDSYCAEFNIVSMMDVPLRIEGKMVGVLCFEQTIIPKELTNEEQRFAISVSQIISLAIETRQRRRIQTKLENELREKNLLIKKSHHRIKNNFSILISLLRLRANTPTNQTSKEILEDCINRIFSIMKVHEQLYKTQGFAVVQLEPYLKELSREIQYSAVRDYQ
jgi:transcriptional regulator with GAF, ATPase, and Fis domain